LIFENQKTRLLKIFFQKAIDPFLVPAIVSLPLTERPSRIDLKRTIQQPGIRDEKLAAALGSN